MSEPIPEPEPEPEPEPVPEPLSEPLSEPVSEPLSEPVSEPTVEPVSEPYPEAHAPSPEVFPDVEPEGFPEGEPESLGEYENIPENEPPASAENSLDAVDFVVAPMVMVGLVLLGALAAYAISHRSEIKEYWRRFGKRYSQEHVCLLDSESIHKLGNSGNSSAISFLDCWNFSGQLTWGCVREDSSDEIIEEMRKIPRHAQVWSALQSQR